jgi:hypothetical protein
VFPVTHWSAAASGPSVSFTGAFTTATDGAYTVVTFSGPGSVIVTGGTIYVWYLVIGGGGSGGQGTGGGGGAGAYWENGTYSYSLAAGTYAITVGAGGVAPGTQPALGTNGSSSIFDSITAIGGGGGAANSIHGASGGSGGGGSFNGMSGNGLPGYGNNGGGGGSANGNYPGGGGGGAGSNGFNGISNNIGGAGGNGLASSITGSSVTRAGGGGGGVYQGGTAGAGGTGGGAAGASDAAPSPAAPTANTGSGGGGARSNSVSANSGASGVVILRFLTAGGGTPPPAPLSSVQFEAAFGGSPYNLPAMSVTAGNLICVITSGGESGTTVVDTAGNTYIPLTETNQGPNFIRNYYCLAALTTASITITINSGSSTGNAGRRAAAFQFGPGYVYDNADVGVSNGSSTFTTPAYTTTAAGLIVCGLYTFGGVTYPHGITGGTPPFTLQEQTPGANVGQLFGLYRFTTAAQVAQTHTVTNTATNHLIRFMGFKPAGPAPAYVSDASGAGGSVVTSNAFALTGGNTVAVLITAGASSGWSLTSVTDTAGNTYTVLPTYAYGLSTYAVIAYKVNATGHAANVVTVSGSHPGGGNCQFQVFQLANVSAFNAEAGRSDGPSTHAATQPVSISARGVIVAVCSNTTGTSDSTITNSLTYVTPAATHTSYAAGYRAYSGAASSQSYDFSGAGNTFRALAAASFI